MLKHFFKALASIGETIRVVASLAFILVIGIAPLCLACVITSAPALRALIIIILYTVGAYTFIFGRRILKSAKYAKKHGYTYKEAYKILSMTEHVW